MGLVRRDSLQSSWKVEVAAHVARSTASADAQQKDDENVTIDRLQTVISDITGYLT